MKKTSTLLSLLFILNFLFLISNSASAQQTGLWSETQNFSTPSYPNQTRTFVYRVPTNYNPSIKYKVFIALHGYGDNPTNFAQTMWQVYGQTSIFGNAILLAPSEGANLSNFIDPAGEDDGILEAILDRAKTMYNLDTTKVYITGFSRGARAGLKMGLDKPLKYRGMLLYTPALLSMSEAQNLTAVQFAYSNGQFIPICMTVGANDPNGYPAIDGEVQNELAAISNKSILYTLPGVAHNIPQTLQDYSNCYNFVETHVYTNTTGINGFSAAQKGIELFPNPSTGSFYIGLFKEIMPGDEVTTTVYDVNGQKVYEQKNLYFNQVHFVNVENQPTGLYMVEVVTPHGRFTQRLLLNH